MTKYYATLELVIQAKSQEDADGIALAATMAAASKYLLDYLDQDVTGEVEIAWVVDVDEATDDE